MKKKRALARLLAQQIPSAKLSDVNGGVTVYQDWRTQAGSSGDYDSGNGQPDYSSDDDIVTD
ncbi:MAG: hypothetical protein WAM82_33335 [Thermoanaerobaculia bacterium]